MPVPGSIKSRRWCRVCFVVFALLLADGPSIGGEMDIATRPLRRFPEQGVSGAGLRGLGYWRAREVLVALQADGPSDEEWSSSTILEIEPGGMLAGAVRVAGRFGTCCLAVDEDAERILLLDEESREVVALGLDGNSKGVSAVPVPIGRLPAEVVTPGSMAWDPISEELLVLDLSARRVMRLTGVAAHGARGRGRSLNAARDFTVDLGPLGIDDPQGLAVEPASGHLFVLSPSQRKVFELSSRGEMLAGYDLGAAGVHPGAGPSGGGQGLSIDLPVRRERQHSSSTKAAGTMWSGSCSSRKRRRRGTSCSADLARRGSLA